MDLQEVVRSVYKKSAKWSFNQLETSLMVKSSQVPLEKYRNSKAKVQKESPKRKRKFCKEGSFHVLVREVCFIQSKLIYKNSPKSI